MASSADLAAGLLAAKTSSGAFLDAVARHGAALGAHARDEAGCSALHWSALCGCLASISACLDLGADASLPSLLGQTPLHFAATNGHYEAAALLLDRGAAIDARDNLGATPLIVATQHSQHLCWLLLADRGADLETRDANGCGPAHWAAFVGNVAALRLLRRRGRRAALADDVDAEGLLPAHRAAAQGRLGALQFLIEEVGVDPRLRVSVDGAVVLPSGTSATAGGAGAINVRVPPPSPAISMVELAEEALAEPAPAPAMAPSSKRAQQARVERLRESAAFLRSSCRDRDALEVGGFAGGLARLRARARAALPLLMARLLAPLAFSALQVATLADLLLGSRSVRALPAALLVLTLSIAAAVTMAAFFLTEPGALDPYGALGPAAYSTLSPVVLIPRLVVAMAQRLHCLGTTASSAPPSFVASLQHLLSPRPLSRGRSPTSEIKAEEEECGEVVGDQSAVQRLLSDVTAAVEEGRRARLAALGEADACLRGPPTHSHTQLLQAAPPGSVAAAVRARVCLDCELLMPLRAGHDVVAARCFPRFDHHARWAGNVVSERNLAQFVSLLAAQAALSLCCVASILAQVEWPLLRLLLCGVHVCVLSGCLAAVARLSADAGAGLTAHERDLTVRAGMPHFYSTCLDRTSLALVPRFRSPFRPRPSGGEVVEDREDEAASLFGGLWALRHLLLRSPPLPSARDVAEREARELDAAAGEALRALRAQLELAVAGEGAGAPVAARPRPPTLVAMRHKLALARADLVAGNAWAAALPPRRG